MNKQGALTWRPAGQNYTATIGDGERLILEVWLRRHITSNSWELLLSDSVGALHPRNTWRWGLICAYGEGDAAAQALAALVLTRWVTGLSKALGIHPDCPPATPRH